MSSTTSTTTIASNSAAAVGKGRRRRRLDDEGEDGASNSADPSAAARPSECESEGEGPDIGSELSEYESAVESADQEEETEEGSETETETGSETESGSDTETEGGEAYTDDEGLDQERQSGDGEEQPDNEKPDDDEDKKNPAYVPRRGAFYEHDFRQGDEGPEGEEEEPAKEPAKPVKKLWQEEGKWSHDRYIDDLQAPKTREELIAIYGYDIRASDKPPEAPPKKPGSGAPRGRRDRSFQEFVPRMAVIDTTEDGADSVPNLGGENFIPYNSGRQGGDRSDSGRGRRGGPRGGGRGNYRNRDIEQNNYRNRQESSRAPNDGSTSQDVKSADVRHQGPGEANEFPSLQESSQQRDRGNEQKTKGYDRYRRDGDFEEEKRDRRYGQTEPRGGGGGGGGNNRRGGYDAGDNRGGNFSNSQDARRSNDNWRSGPQNYNNQDRGGFRRGGSRQGDFSRGSRDENWRASNESRGNYNNKGDSYRRDQRDTRYGDNSNRGSRMGNSGDYRAHSDGHGQNYEQPQRYQQVKQEFTNTSMRSIDDRPAVHQRGSGESKKPESALQAHTTSMKESSDISKNVVVSSSHEKGQREKVQTINVTITSTTTEKKSYAKERRAKGALPEGNMLGGATDAKQVGPPMPAQSGQYQHPQHAGGATLEGSLQAQGKRYSSQRQQAIASRPFTEPPPTTDSKGSKLYNPAMPPPPFFPRDQTAAVAASSVPHPNVQQPPLPPSVAVPDPSRFNAAMLPPVTMPLQYPLPVSNAGLALAPGAAGAGAVAVNPAIFQQATHPPPSQAPHPPGTAIMAPPFLPAGMIYSGNARVPPPHNAGQAPPPFPLPMAYTSPPPQAPVAVPPQTQPGVSQQAAPANSQHKVYRGDITYYAPELQQPPRVPQKRPKAAIPIIDPQVIREQKRRERQAQQEKAELSKPAAPVQNQPSSQGQNEKDRTQDSVTAPPTSPAPSAPVKEEVPNVQAEPDSTQTSPKVSEKPSVAQPAIQQDHHPVPVDSAETSSRLKEEVVPEISPVEASVVPVNTAAVVDVREELPEPSVKSEPGEVSAPTPAAVPSQEVSDHKDSTISTIVAVDSRPPLTIVQSFSDPIDGVAKGLSTLELKKESLQTKEETVDKVEDASQCAEVSSSAS
ncbi:hypothetical protein EGW08_004646 [Elysia chlorotica]|uniref:Protein CASC3 n=1 Tax=Elysia chlorotica TaxID=188477 RepID=A0A433U187_ELYCH|nr:hypothetical protein EGW08_004646 [Elysia chlorotica]